MASKVEVVRLTPTILSTRRRRNRRPSPPVVPAAFAEVRLPAEPGSVNTRLEAQLVNGAKLAIETNDLAQELLLTAIVALSRRR